MGEGTLGSTDRRIPICVDKLFDEMRDEKSSLAESWAEHQITDWGVSLALIPMAWKLFIFDMIDRNIFL